MALALTTGFVAVAHAEPPAAPRVTRVERAETAAKADPLAEKQEVVARLGETIALTVSGLNDWAAKGPKAVLFLKDQPMTDIVPTFFDKAAGKVWFKLERKGTSDDSKAAWAAVLANPIWYDKTLKVSLGTLADGPLPSDVCLTLDTIPFDLVTVGAVAVYALALGLFAWLVRRSDLLRDSGPVPDPPDRRPYSLGRCQMAFWFFLIVGSFLAIWVLTKDRDVVPPSALALMGIASGTALGAVAIDASKRASAQADRDGAQTGSLALQNAIADLQAKVNAPGAASAEVQAGWARDLAARQADLAAVVAKLADLQDAAAPSKSKGFWKDLLSDGDGVALHRFQLLVWTVVLGLVFIATVSYNLTMPTFNETLLGLLGISNATYVGFKFPEKGKP